MEYNTLFAINIGLVCLCLAAIVVIVIMIHENTQLNDEMKQELKEIEKKCPPCNCPKNPDCNLRCPDYPLPRPGDSVDSVDSVDSGDSGDSDSEKDNDSGESTKRSLSECPECPKCPSVEEIVSGIYPGRNPKVVDGGRYFSVDASNVYDGLSTSNFYEKNYKFPIDKILKPDSPEMNKYNLGGEEQINNSIDNEYVDTSISKTLPGVDKTLEIPEPLNYREPSPFI